jgi:nucleoside-diphosphate-sugar epimerase
VIALIAKAAARLDPFPVWGDGKQTRNFTYVHDTALGLALAVLLTGFEVLKLGTAQHHTSLELLDVIFDHVGWRPERLDLQVDKPVGVRSRAADNTRIKTLTGWEPTTPLGVGMARTIDWYVQTTTPERLRDLGRLLMTR